MTADLYIADLTPRELMVIAENTKAKVRIKPGTTVMQDHTFFSWPACFPPGREYRDGEYQCKAKNPDMEFSATWNGSFWGCKAPGYGEIGNYGSGSILVRGYDNVEIIQ